MPDFRKSLFGRLPDKLATRYEYKRDIGVEFGLQRHCDEFFEGQGEYADAEEKENKIVCEPLVVRVSNTIAADDYFGHYLIKKCRNHFINTYCVCKGIF